MNELFTERYKIIRLNVEDALTDTVFPASTAFLDMSENPRVVFLVNLGAIADALTFQVKQDTSATQTAAIKDVDDAAVTIAATDDDQFFVIEVDASMLDTNNDFRYVTLDVSDNSGSNYAAITALQYGEKMPVDQGTEGTDYVDLVAVVSN